MKKLRAKNYDGSDDDWVAILTYVLISKSQANLSPSQEKSLSVGCAITGKKKDLTLSIIFRNEIEGIIQRLGVIELAFTDDTDDVDLFSWTLQVIEQRDKLEADATAYKTKADAEHEVEETLQKQLSDLAEAKIEYETQLLTKFTTLLNEKKLKIRNLQRVLQTARVDPKRLQEMQATIDAVETKGTRRGKKRQADEDAEDEDDSDGFEAMDIETTTKDHEDAESSTSDSERTPSPEEPSSHEDDDLDVAAKAPRPPKTRSQGKAARPSSPLPAPRQLPFQAKTGRSDGHSGGGGKGQKQKTPEPRVPGNDDEDDEETASEDDEL